MQDWPGIWQVVEETVRPGDTYAIDPDISESDVKRIWWTDAIETFVAEAEGEIVGTYILKPNQGGCGDHVANAAFMVAERARGKGVGEAMGRDVIERAAAAGYRGMQFNFVVSTNTGAVRLWKKLGFDIVGTLPRAFRHPTKGEVDAYVMYRSLV